MPAVTSQSVQYNGALFSSLYRSRIHSRPIQDEAKRTTVYVEHRLELDGYVTAPVDDTMTDLRKKLTRPAGSLTWNLKGFGDFRINSPGSVLLDAAYGPWPELMEFVPLGGDCNAARVSWAVTVRIPECDFAKYKFAVLELNWTVDHDLDESGYTVENVRGHLVIPVTRKFVLDNSVPDSVDRYRELLASDVKQGFQRKGQHFTISSDRRRLEFQWRDEEVPVPLPRAVTVADVRHTIQTSGPALRNWSITFDASLQLARGATKEQALDVFWGIIGSRTRDIVKNKGTLIPKVFRATDACFGREVNCHAELFHFHPQEIGKFLTQSGLFQPIAGTDFNGWQASLTALRSNQVRGWAGLTVRPEDDAIIDLCVNNNASPGSTLSAQPPGKSNLPDGRVYEALLDTILKPLSPGNSWIEYKIRVIEEEDSGVVRHKPSPTPDRGLSTGDPFGNPSKGPTPLPTGIGGPDPMGQKASARDDDVGGFGSPSKNGPNPPDYYQRAVTPTRRLGLEGFAERVGYRVPVPRVVQVGGVAAVEQYRWCCEEVVGSIGDIPIFRTDWQIWYMLADAPAGPWPWPANPVLGTDGGLTGNQGDLRPF